MKLKTKLLPLISIGAVATVVTPLTVSCGSKNEWKEVVQPDTTGWEQSQYSSGEKPEVAEQDALEEYFNNEDLNTIVERDVQWSGYESKEIIKEALQQSDYIKNSKISKFQEYFKDFSWDKTNKVASYKMGINAQISLGLQWKVSQSMTLEATADASIRLEIETHKIPMMATTYWNYEQRTWHPAQHQMISIDYLTLLDGWEDSKYDDAYEKLEVSVNGMVNQKFSDQIDINFKSGTLVVNKDTEVEFVEMLYLIAAEFTVDGWFSYFFDSVTLPVPDPEI